MTSCTLEQRLTGHLHEMLRYPKAHKSRWLRELTDAGFGPEIFLLESSSVDVWESREKYWIAWFGDALTNMTVGGDGRVGVPHSEETKSKIGAKSRGRSTSEETKELIRKKMIERGAPPQERRERIAATLRGRRQDPDIVNKRTATLLANESAMKKVGALAQSFTPDELKQQAAKSLQTMRERGTGLASAPKSTCDNCARLLRKIDFPRHRCAPKDV